MFEVKNFFDVYDKTILYRNKNLTLHGISERSLQPELEAQVELSERNVSGFGFDSLVYLEKRFSKPGKVQGSDSVDLPDNYRSIFTLKLSKDTYCAIESVSICFYSVQ